ncbi:hypothetical protein EB118_26300 [bacterium]|nr:hypothetical protein [Actinomycetota bacterium]NDG33554.1 hypothetical protein [bacterium]
MKIDWEKVREVFNIREMAQNLVENIGHISAETLTWIGVILIHMSTIPTLIAILTGLTEKMPPVDLVGLVWLGLLMFFLRSVIARDLLNIITIGFGFFIQATLMGLIIFK